MSKYVLDNKKIILTGASSGIGKEIARILISKYNATVIGIARNEQKLLDVKEEFKDNFIPYRLDVSNKEEFEGLFNYLTANKILIDGIINCAGVLPKFSAFGDSEIESYEYSFNTNFYSIVYSAKYLIPLLDKSKSPIMINVLSSSALCPFAGVSIYSASKAAGERFSECIALEDNGVKVITCMPGFTKTNVMRSQNLNDKEQNIIDKISLPATTVAKKILNGAKKGKSRIIVGFDAHLMNFLFKFFPRTAPKIITWLLRKSKMQIFDKI